jgi:hypothetical protein
MLGYDCCLVSVPLPHMDWPTALPILTALGGFASGVVTTPLKDLLSRRVKRQELRRGLYGEVARLYSLAVIAACQTSSPLIGNLSGGTDAYRKAMEDASLYYRLSEKYFFDDVYRLILRFGSISTPTLSAADFVEFVDEQYELRKFNQKLFRTHCDVMANKHLSSVPTKLLGTKELLNLYDKTAKSQSPK